MLAPASQQARYVRGEIDDEGCGFVAIELQRVKWSLLIVSVYLMSGVGLTGGPNPTILSSLRPHLYHNWLVVGDWNVAVEDVPSGQLALPQLQGFKGSIKEDDPGPVPQRPVELGMIGTVPLRQDCMTVACAAFAQQAADRHFGEADGRGILTIPPRTSL